MLNPCFCFVLFILFGLCSFALEIDVGISPLQNLLTAVDVLGPSSSCFDFRDECEFAFYLFISFVFQCD